MSLTFVFYSVLGIFLFALAFFVIFWPVLLLLKHLGKGINTRYFITALLTLTISGVGVAAADLRFLVPIVIGIPVLALMWWGDHRAEARQRSRP
ncbi:MULTISPECIES: hypothetical protein [Trichocoleus]|uniref:Uncharacterized protein n=1 Tax=Trichocoleus desertorum GB2-A4 TaxID=2933944 RepID=A0ABV0JE53_9CYAN|nr:hypothetical protein [Trichocoleus sp. FACHB-46]MBD1863011.1 hypothetical protein [Trichocoleus sp. FACHB-46]